MKRIYSLLCAAAVGLSGIAVCVPPELTVFAAEEAPTSGECGENLTWEFDEKTGTLTIAGTGELGGWFGQHTPWTPYADQIKKAVLPEGLRIIRAYTFFGCRNLTEVTIPESVLLIGGGAFATCPSLKKITLPENVAYIGNEAFGGTGSVEITFLNSGCSLGNHAIYSDMSASGYTFDGVICGYDRSGAWYYAKTEGYTFKSLGEAPEWEPEHCGACGEDMIWELGDDGTLTISGTGDMWDYFHQLNQSPWSMFSSYGGKEPYVKKVIIQDGVTSIGQSAFTLNEEIESIEMADSVTKVASYSFMSTSCPIQVSANLETIGQSAFDYASGILDEDGFGVINGKLVAAPDQETIVVPKNVAAIESGAFGDAVSLKSLTLPENVTYIAPGAISHPRWMSVRSCADLSEITVLNPECVFDDYIPEDGEGYNDPYRSYGRAIAVYGMTTDGIYLENSYNGVIRGYDGSTAQAYAEKWGYTFESLGEAPGENEPETGDLDGDGEIGVTDAQLALNAYVQGITGAESGLTDAQIKAADVDGDGQLTVTDAQLILNYYVQNTVLGADKGWDELTS